MWITYEMTCCDLCETLEVRKVLKGLLAFDSVLVGRLRY
jgi:hypothetical protein